MSYIDIDFSDKTILITGGAGFIGSNLAFYFQEKFPQSHIVILDCFRSEVTFANGNLQSFGHYKNLIGFKGDVICGNINHKADLSLLDDYTFDYIFHQAAISDTRVYDQELVIQTNVNSFYDLLNIAKKNNAFMVYASSAATYGSLASPQVVGSESPENPYGFSKYAMDQIANSFMQQNPEMTIVGLISFVMSVFFWIKFYIAQDEMFKKFHDFSITTGAYCFVVLGIIFYSLSLAGYIEEVVHQDVCFPLNFLFFAIGTQIGQVYFYKKHLV